MLHSISVRSKLLILSFVWAFSADAQVQQSLSYYANKCKMKIGAAVGAAAFYNATSGSPYDLTVKNNFNILVAENEMKYDWIEYAQNKFRWTYADQLVAYAHANNMQVRGHNLCWHMNVPSFIQDANGVFVPTLTRASLQAMFKNHITQVVSRYKGKVQQWDVVNEPFASASSTGAMRTNVWQTVIGNDYIDSAFVWARRADPTAKLYLNEFGCETQGTAKAEYMYNFVVGMKARNIPIDGVGFQCHISTSGMNYTTLDQNIKRYAALGIDVAITELDVSVKVASYKADSTLWLATQATIYKNLIQLCLKNPNFKTFMTWGFTDLYSWIPSYSNNLSGYALLFDNLFRPKPAYTSILNELYTESLKSGVSDVQNDAKIKIKKLDNKIIITSENTISNFQLFDLQGKLLFVSNFRNNQVEIPLDRNFGNLVIANIQFENGEIVSCKVLTKN